MDNNNIPQDSPLAIFAELANKSNTLLEMLKTGKGFVKTEEEKAEWVRQRENNQNAKKAAEDLQKGINEAKEYFDSISKPA